MSLAFTLREMKSHWLPWAKWQEMTQLLAGPLGGGGVAYGSRQSTGTWRGTGDQWGDTCKNPRWRSGPWWWRWKCGEADRFQVCSEGGDHGFVARLRLRGNREEWGMTVAQGSWAQRSKEGALRQRCPEEEARQSLRPVTPQLSVLPGLSCPAL